jgi:hypothetical protein
MFGHIDSMNRTESSGCEARPDEAEASIERAL